MGSYGGGMHMSDVPDEDIIPFQKVCYQSSVFITCDRILSSCAVDCLRNHGHIRSSRLPHQTVPPLDHDPCIQPIPQSRHLHLCLPRCHVGLLYPRRDSQNPHLQTHLDILEPGQRWQLSGPNGHYLGRCRRQCGQ